jgi:MSHA biogenesis protein MshI
LFSWLGKSKPRGRAGVAITAGGLAAAEFSPHESQPVLTGCGFFPLPVQDGSDQLDRLSRERKWQGQQLAVCLDRSQFSLSQVEAPVVEQDELSQALAWKVKEQIDFPLDELVLDYVELPATRSAAQMLYTVSSRHSTIQQIVDNAKQSEATLERIDIPALSLQNIASRLPISHEGVALLNLTHQNSLLTLGREGRLYLSREIDISSHELSSGEGGMDEFRRQQLLDDLLLTVQRSLDYYDSMFSDPPIKYLLISNGDGRFDGLVEHLGGNLQLAVASLNLLDAVTVDDQLHLDPAWYGELMLAMGAALWPEEGAA